jgi:hypothetical protein
MQAAGSVCIVGQIKTIFIYLVGTFMYARLILVCLGGVAQTDGIVGTACCNHRLIWVMKRL